MTLIHSVRSRLHVSRTLRFAGVLLAIVFLSVSAQRAAAQSSGPTPEEYSTHVGNAQIVPPGDLRLDGRKALCGHRPTVLDNQLDDYGAAYPGFIILNPRLMNKVTPVVKMWIYAHECGHQFRGPDEETADCFAVQRGRRQGWLTNEGLDEICEFIRPARGSSMHFSGGYRCEKMRQCYVDPTIK